MDSEDLQFSPVQMTMEAQTSSSFPFSTAGLGPRELSFSHSTYFDHFQFYQSVFWSTCGNDEVHCVKPCLTAAAEDGVITDKIKCFLPLLLELLRPGCLVQFWGLVKIGERRYLTTCDHPFALHYTDLLQDLKQLCEYRKHCLEYLIPVEDDDEIGVDGVQELNGGPPGRVFRSGLPEHAPDIRHYTNIEYPQLDYAVGRVQKCWVSPVYYPAQHLPCGVLEIVWTNGFYLLPKEMLAKLQNPLREVNLTPTCISLAEVSSCQNSEIAEIDQVLVAVNIMHGLDVTEIWTTSGEILNSHYGKDFIRKGQGVVGKAFSSKRACFCRDIRLLSMAEYPFVPKARHCQDSACFAVCLQSFCSDNHIYVLEFFLPMNEKDYADLRTLLHKLMETLREYLRTSFKIASGQELGQRLIVEVIKVSAEVDFDSFEIYNTAGIELQGGEGMMQLDFSSQQVDAANASKNVIHGGQNGIDGSPPRPDQESVEVECSTSIPAMNGIYEQQNGPIGYSSTGQELLQNHVASTETSGNEVTNIKKKKPNGTPKRRRKITLEKILENSTRTLTDAAKVLLVSEPTLKRTYQDYGFHSWREVYQCFVEREAVQPSTKDIEEQHQSNATSLEDGSSMWVKVENGRYRVKFSLPFSARKSDLDENVAERFKLSIGSFKIEYQDEDNDWFLITCDKDLSTSMSTLSSLGRKAIEMRVS